MDAVTLLSPDESLRKSLGLSLEKEGFAVAAVTDPERALPEVLDAPDRSLVLEMFLWGQSGFALCRALRERPETRRTPIVILARTDEEIDRLLAFEAGADDVVRWPTSARELALRLRAIQRRVRSFAGGESLSARVLAIGRLEIDLDRRRVRCDDHQLELTPNEFEILTLLASRPGRVFTRAAILEAVWGPDEARTLRVVDTHVRGIRRKLGSAGQALETVWSVGYRLRDRDPASTRA